MRIVLPSLLVITGCIRNLDFPYVGDCAEYPSGQYEFGQIGIGSCIAGPNEIRFAGDEDNLTLLVTNANPYKIFDGGSLLAIPWNSIDLGDSTNEVHTLNTSKMDLPNLGFGIEVYEELGFIGLRESKDARSRVYDDAVMLVDLSDPAQPEPSTRGTDGGKTVTVMSDPVDAVVDPETGLAFVANRTNHTISVLDTTEETIKVIKPWPETTVTAAVYHDNSDMNGQARITHVDVLGDDLLRDDAWTLTWVEGTWRLWLPHEDGLFRTTSQLQRDEYGQLLFHDNAMGTEFHLDDASAEVIEVSDPSHSVFTGRMLYASEGSLWGAASGDYLGDWVHDTVPSLEPGVRSWAGWLSGPQVTPNLNGYQLFFDAQDDDLGGEGPSVIGTGSAEDGLVFSVAADPALTPTHPHEGDHIADPHVIFDAETQLWRMVYSAFDGEFWSIGHAYSEDLEDWVSDGTPLFEADLGAAAPVLHMSSGRWLLWYSEWDGLTWRIAAAESRDGTNFERIPGARDFHPSVLDENPLRPPGIALQGSSSDTFQIRGENFGHLSEPLLPGLAFAAPSAGWSIEVVAGAWLDTGDAGPKSNGGIRVDSTRLEADGTGTAWTTLSTRSGAKSIGIAEVTDSGHLIAGNGPVFSGGNANFESKGVSYPVVFASESSVTGDDTNLMMLYAGKKNSKYSVGLATSTDGINWTSEGQVFKPGGEDWDNVSVIPNSVVPLSSGGWRLWYSGFDGSRWRIGSAVSSDARNWTREEAPRSYQFGLGEPGAWDDSGVKDAWVITDGTGEHLWYSGSDGSSWRVGYAFRAKGASAFTRPESPITEETRPIITFEDGPFHRSDVTRPVVHATDSGFSMLYGGWTAGTVRVGKAFCFQPDRANLTPRWPRVGDTLTFQTERGDENARAIPLDGLIEGRETTGIGLTALQVDRERGFLYAASKLYSGLFVIDIRDDTDTATGFFDKNYLDIEAVLALNTSSWATGFRQILPVPGSDFLYTLVDSPATIVTIDLSAVTDDEYADYVINPATGFLATPRGLERDEGAKTQSSVGPGQMVLHPDGKRLFVSNFNRNSITTYDLSMGPYGTMLGDTPNVGENPYALTLSPDGNTLVFGNYTGEIDGTVAHSNIGLLDVNEESPSYLEVLTWIVNR